MYNEATYQPAFYAVRAELIKAKSKYKADFNSNHEGYAVLLEEVDEMWEDVKKDRTKESVQVAAMAIRYIGERGEIPYK